MKDTNKKEVKEQDLDKVNGGAIYGSRGGNATGIAVNLFLNQSNGLQTDQAIKREEPIDNNENK